MSHLPLRLDYPSSLNASEFWRSHPVLHFNMQKLVGDRLMDIPILEFQDIFTRSCCCYKFPKKIHSSIVMVVDDFTKIREIILLYRVKVLEKPKCSWLPVLKKKEVMELVLFKETLSKETQFLFKEGYYYEKPSSCLALYHPAKVSIY